MPIRPLHGIAALTGLIGLLAPVAAADEVVVAQPPAPPALPMTAPENLQEQAASGQQPWVGIRLGKLEAAVRAHAPAVPEGVGFVVQGVDSGGPAELAGIRPFDILWRLGDQMLVNEAQFATLLRMHAPGETVVLSLVRSGEPLDCQLVIGTMPEDRRSAANPPFDISLAPAGVPGMPKVVMVPGQRTAHSTRSDGSVMRLYFTDGKPQIDIDDPDGKSVYSGPLRRDGEWVVPKKWRCQAGALLRGLSHAERSGRGPRPRVVVPPSQRD